MNDTIDQRINDLRVNVQVNLESKAAEIVLRLNQLDDNIHKRYIMLCISIYFRMSNQNETINKSSQQIIDHMNQQKIQRRKDNKEFYNYVDSTNDKTYNKITKSKRFEIIFSV